MRKILIAVLFMSVGVGSVFGESDTVKMMKQLGCVNTLVGWQNMGVFCGGRAKYSCIGTEYTESNRTIIYSCGSDEAACSVFDSWACCGGTTTQQGRFVEYTKGAFLTPNTKELDDGGTCTYYTNPCGTVVTDCNEPDDCPAGQILRMVGTTLQCTEACAPSWGYENEYSGNCVACSAIGHGVDANGVCVDCGQGSFFMLKDNCVGMNCCHSKSGATLYTKAQFAECWRCGANREAFHKCVKGTRTPDIKQQCGLKD